MTITTDTIQYSNSKELFQYNGLKEWKGFTVTRQLKEGETLEQAAEKLVSEMELLHQKHSQSIENEMKGTHVLKVPQEPPNMSDPELDAAQKDQALIDTINYCTNTRSVEMFRKEVERRNRTQITEAFENKLNSLKNQQL